MAFQLRIVETTFSLHTPKSDRFGIASAQQRGGLHRKQRISIAGSQKLDRLAQHGNLCLQLVNALGGAGSHRASLEAMPPPPPPEMPRASSPTRRSATSNLRLCSSRRVSFGRSNNCK